MNQMSSIMIPDGHIGFKLFDLLPAELRKSNIVFLKSGKTRHDIQVLQ